MEAAVHKLSTNSIILLSNIFFINFIIISYSIIDMHRKCVICSLFLSFKHVPYIGNTGAISHFSHESFCLFNIISPHTTCKILTENKTYFTRLNIAISNQ